MKYGGYTYLLHPVVCPNPLQSPNSEAIPSSKRDGTVEIGLELG
jgi:hypothetical protein